MTNLESLTPEREPLYPVRGVLPNHAPKGRRVDRRIAAMHRPDCQGSGRKI